LKLAWLKKEVNTTNLKKCGTSSLGKDLIW